MEKNTTIKKEKGFTLVEVVVALALFLLIVDVAVVIFISIINQQRKILQEQESLNQTSYALEYVSKSLRTARKDLLGNCLSNPPLTYPGYFYLLTHYNEQAGIYNGVKFVTYDGVCSEFFLDSEGILKEKRDAAEPQDILFGKFTVENVSFVINGDKNLFGASQGDLLQPRISMTAKVKVVTGSTEQERVIQTSVSNINVND